MLPHRPLPAALAPLLTAQLDSVLGQLCTAFPPARACLEADAAGSGSLQLQKLASFRGRSVALAAIRDEHDGDISAELVEGETTALCCIAADLWRQLLVNPVMELLVIRAAEGTSS